MNIPENIHIKKAEYRGDFQLSATSQHSSFLLACGLSAAIRHAKHTNFY